MAKDNKGASFEIEVYNMLNEILETEFGLSPKLASVYHKKGYYSKDRGKDIITDVSIEIKRPSATEPYLIWIWECKDYDHRVPIDDVEEFHSKLEQIGMDKTKGTIAARSEFQESCITYAKSKGIMLTRMLAPGTRLYVTESKKDFSEVATKGLTLKPGGAFGFPSYVLKTDHELTVHIWDAFREELEEALKATDITYVEAFDRYHEYLGEFWRTRLLYIFDIDKLEIHETDILTSKQNVQMVVNPISYNGNKYYVNEENYAKLKGVKENN